MLSRFDASPEKVVFVALPDVNRKAFRAEFFSDTLATGSTHSALFFAFCRSARFEGFLFGTQLSQVSHAIMTMT